MHVVNPAIMHAFEVHRRAMRALGTRVFVVFEMNRESCHSHVLVHVTVRSSDDYLVVRGIESPWNWGIQEHTVPLLGSDAPQVAEGERRMIHRGVGRPFVRV